MLLFALKFALLILVDVVIVHIAFNRLQLIDHQFGLHVFDLANQVVFRLIRRSLVVEVDQRVLQVLKILRNNVADLVFRRLNCVQSRIYIVILLVKTAEHALHRRLLFLINLFQVANSFGCLSNSFVYLNLLTHYLMNY